MASKAPKHPYGRPLFDDFFIKMMKNKSSKRTSRRLVLADPCRQRWPNHRRAVISFRPLFKKDSETDHCSVAIDNSPVVSQFGKIALLLVSCRPPQSYDKFWALF